MPNHIAQPGHRRAVQRLHLEGQPQECARRNQRHGVDRKPGQAQGCLGGGGFGSATASICPLCVCHNCSFRPAAPFGLPVCHAAAAATFSVARLAACLPCTQPSVVALAPTVPHCCRRSPAREKGCFYVFLIWESSCFCAMCCRDLLRRAKVGQPFRLPAFSAIKRERGWGKSPWPGILTAQVGRAVLCAPRRGRVGLRRCAALRGLRALPASRSAFQSGVLSIGARIGSRWLPGPQALLHQLFGNLHRVQGGAFEELIAG